jgi:prolyl-tRNA editing enzyme YbaK/EbsC (Cys-tRNA(Pro) deacylase)
VSAVLSPSAQRVQDALHAAGADSVVIEYETTARTANEAAALLQCKLGQIAKSIIFRIAGTDEGVLVVTAGSNRVDERRVEAHLSVALAKADAAFVRTVTGFAIGGVAPLGALQALRVLLDEDLLRYDRVYAAGGTPQALFAIAPQDLLRVAGAQVASVKQS